MCIDITDYYWPNRYKGKMPRSELLGGPQKGAKGHNTHSIKEKYGVADCDRAKRGSTQHSAVLNEEVLYWCSVSFNHTGEYVESSIVCSPLIYNGGERSEPTHKG